MERQDRLDEVYDLVLGVLEETFADSLWSPEPQARRGAARQRQGVLVAELAERPNIRGSVLSHLAKRILDDRPTRNEDLPIADIARHWRSLLASADRGCPLPVEAPPSLQENDAETPFDTLQHVERLIIGMINGKAIGPDRLPSEFMKAARTENAEWLQALFQYFWREGLVPSIWRRAYLNPIYKGDGARTEGGNYRGIALMSHLRKTYEFAVMQHLESVVGPRSNLQFGFSKGKGIYGPIWGLHTELRRARRSGLSPQVLLVDIEKAYDTVDRNILWEKLAGRAEGSPRIIQLIRELVDSNDLILRVDADEVDRVSSQRGLPQGSCLSPVLYTYFIDDLPAALGLVRGASCKLYADDIAIRTSGLDPSGAELQRYCDRLQTYAAWNGFRVSTKKTVLLGGPSVHIADHLLQPQIQARYLGVPFTVEGGDFEAAQRGSLANATRALRRLKDLGMMDVAFDASRRLHLIKSFVISRLDFATGLPCSGYSLTAKTALYDEAITMALRGSEAAAPPAVAGEAGWLTDDLRLTTGLLPYGIRRDVAAARIAYQAFGAGVPWFPCRELIEGSRLFNARAEPWPPPLTSFGRHRVRWEISTTVRNWARRHLQYRPLFIQSPVWERATAEWVTRRWIPMMREPRPWDFVWNRVSVLTCMLANQRRMQRDQTWDRLQAALRW